MPDNYYESRKKWNAKNYKQINIAINPELAESFRITCEQNKTPMREALISFISEYTSIPSIPKKQKVISYSVRGNRRKALATIITQLEMIKDAEEQYKENMPENLKNSSRYDSAEQATMIMEEAIGLLGEVY